MSTSSVVIAICAAVPAMIVITACAIVFYSRRDTNRALRRQKGPPHENDRFDEQRSDVPNAHRSQEQRQLPRPPPVLEQPPPPFYTYPAKRTRRQPPPLFPSIHLSSRTANVHQSLPDITPSIYAAMPPSYAELFLTPYNLTNQ